MLNKLIPDKFHSKCPEYQGFSVITVRPNETFIEPERTANRLKKCLAILIYAQKWFSDTIGEKGIHLCTPEIAASVTQILAVVSDKSAAWNTTGEKMRPTKILLDVYGTLYTCINTLQEEIRSLANHPVYIAREKSTHKSLQKHMAGVRSALLEIRQVMETMPKQKSPSILQSSMRAQGFPRIDLSDESEDEEGSEVSDDISSFSASPEDIRRRAKMIRRRRTRGPHLYSVESRKSSTDACDVRPTTPEVDGVLQQSTEVSVLKSPTLSYTRHVRSADRDVNYREGDYVLRMNDSEAESMRRLLLKGSEPRSRSPTISISRSSAFDLETVSAADATQLTPQRDLKHVPSDSSISRNAEELNSSSSMLDSKWPAASTTIDERREKNLSARNSEAVNDSDDASDDSHIDATLAPAARIAVVRKSFRQDRPYQKAMILQKHRRSASIRSTVSSSTVARTDSLMNDYATFQFGIAPATSDAHSDKSSLYQTSISRCDSQSSAHTSPRLVSYAEMRVLPEFVAYNSGEDDNSTTGETAWVMDNAGLLCLDTSKSYTLAGLAQLQRYFGPRLEPVVLKASKNVLKSKSRTSAEIAYDGKYWRFCA